MSFFVTLRQPLTTSKRFLRPYDATVPDEMDTSDTKDTEFRAADAANAPHIGRPMKGCTVGMDAFASPICTYSASVGTKHQGERRRRSQQGSRHRG